MTPEQKAIDILEKLIPHVYNEYDGNGDGWIVYNAKRHTIQCALILVNEIIDALDESLIHADIEWWKEVKQELEKL